MTKKFLLAALSGLVFSMTSLAATTPEKSQHPVSDSAITAKVKTALLKKDDLKSLHIHVDTKNGVVTLSGSVPSEDQSTTAADVAKGVEGVTDVNNTLVAKADK